MYRFPMADHPVKQYFSGVISQQMCSIPFILTENARNMARICRDANIASPLEPCS
jgi:hypothetical protein